jgi:selenocysteine lyase/cysteine desulfurase
VDVTTVAPTPAPTLAEEFRSYFPVFDHRVYLNSCSQGALSRQVRAAYESFLDGWEYEGSQWGAWVDRQELVRSAFADLVNAPLDAIAVTTSVSAGLSAFVSSLDLSGGRNRIVITDFEFPTAGQIAHAQALRGAEIVMVPARDGTVRLEDIEAAVDERTALVVMTHVCYRNGSRLDPKAVARIAHDKGALLALDAYQSIGSLPIDVVDLDVDVLAAGALKYLLASAGLGFLYVRSSLIEDRAPTITGWFADTDVFAMDHRRYAPSPTARRFQSGTPPVPNLFAGLAGIDLVRGVGVHAIEAHVQDLVDRFRGGLDELGATIVTPADRQRRGAMVAVASSDDNALVAKLDAMGFGVSCRDGNLRVSLHLYNSIDDIDNCLLALRQHRDLLR